MTPMGRIGIALTFAALGTFVGFVAATTSGCAHVTPVVTCMNGNVSNDDVRRVETDIEQRNWTDLEAEAKVLGWDVLGCVIDDATTRSATLRPKAEEFRKLHVELRGGVASIRIQVEPRGWTSNVPLDPATMVTVPIELGVSYFSDVACLNAEYKKSTGEIVKWRRWYCESI